MSQQDAVLVNEKLDPQARKDYERFLNREARRNKKGDRKDRRHA